jgi:hypothetical protein
MKAKVVSGPGALATFLTVACTFKTWVNASPPILGLVTKQCVAFGHVILEAGVLPKVICVAAVSNPTPSISAFVPPVFGPEEGQTRVTLRELNIHSGVPSGAST